VGQAARRPRAARRDPPRPGADTVTALLDRVRTTRLAALRWSERATLLRARVAFLRREFGGGDWPDWTDAALLATLDDWLAPYLVGATGAADLARLDTELLLSSQLGWDGSTHLADLAPSHLETPTGRAIVIDYSRDVPTASVRVQDLFGVREHPTVAGGVPVSLELLSPADRPIQITSDLPGFWAGSWAEVRKEMAGRYPKHQWPTDPANATPKRLK
jgi:ATP-dependent helicase HrpB